MLFDAYIRMELDLYSAERAGWKATCGQSVTWRQIFAKTANAPLSSTRLFKQYFNEQTLITPVNFMTSLVALELPYSPSAICIPQPLTEVLSVHLQCISVFTELCCRLCISYLESRYFTEQTCFLRRVFKALSVKKMTCDSIRV